MMIIVIISFNKCPASDLFDGDQSTGIKLVARGNNPVNFVFLAPVLMDVSYVESVEELATSLQFGVRL